MKQFFLLICVGLLTIGSAGAQQMDTVFQKREVIIIDEEPVSSPQRGQVREIIIRQDVRRTTKKESLSFFSGIGLGYNGLVENLDNLKLPEDAIWMDQEPKSINFNLMIMKYEFNVAKHFGFGTGLELEVNNYRFSNNITLGVDRDNYVVRKDVPYDLKKTKLVNCFLNVPFLARVGIGHKNQVELYGGVVGGWRWNSYTKLKSSEHGKNRHRQNYNLRNFHYGYTAGVTFHNIGVYATYYPHSIFKTDRGPEVRQVNIGITFSY